MNSLQPRLAGLQEEMTTFQDFLKELGQRPAAELSQPLNVEWSAGAAPPADMLLRDDLSKLKPLVNTQAIQEQIYQRALQDRINLQKK